MSISSFAGILDSTLRIVLRCASKNSASRAGDHFAASDERLNKWAELSKQSKNGRSLENKKK